MYTQDILACLAKLSKDEVFTPPKVVKHTANILSHFLKTPAAISGTSGYCLAGRAVSVCFATRLRANTGENQTQSPCSAMLLNPMDRRHSYGIYVRKRWLAINGGMCQKRVTVLWSKFEFDNATTVGNMWIIPTTEEKPIDARITHCSQKDGKKVKPFLKWAGGKGQLLTEIEKYYPFEDGKITKYAEPFVGGGAVLFDILSKYNLTEVYISDINAELINAYLVIRDDIEELVAVLMVMQSEFVPLDTERRKIYYTAKRERFNNLKINANESVNIEKAALMIFLNKTCFNGLFRVNRRGQFNVPMGAYKNPMICDEGNMRAVSEKLQNVKIVCGDYRESSDFIDENTFVYFDPPYRPITDTANFTAYTENLFNDEKQIELAKFVDDMHRKGAKIVISNSDPKNSNTEDNFFDNIYSSHKIKRVEATRMINSNSEGRGRIKELIISNF